MGLGWTEPDFSPLSRREKTLVVNIPCRISQRPRHLLIDSTAERGAHAVTLPRKNAQPWKTFTVGAASRYEEDQKTIRGIVFPTIGCIVSNCWASGSWQRTSTGKSPSSKCASPS